MSRCTQPPDAGFSLLEMLTVLVILSCAAAVSLPSVWGRPVEPGLRAVALDMAAALRLARSRAIATNRPVRVYFDLEGRRYWLEGEARRRSVPGSLDIAATLSESGRMARGAGSYAFAADGSASGGAIELASAAGKATISVDWLTGRTHVAWH